MANSTMKSEPYFLRTNVPSASLANFPHTHTHTHIHTTEKSIDIVFVITRTSQKQFSRKKNAEETSITERCRPFDGPFVRIWGYLHIAKNTPERQDGAHELFIRILLISDLSDRIIVHKFPVRADSFPRVVGNLIDSRVWQ